MIDDPLVVLVSKIEHALAAVDRDVADGDRRWFVRPLLSRAHAAGRGRYPGVAAFYLFQALGEVLSWREESASRLREELMELAISARILTRWTGAVIPCDSLEVARELKVRDPVPPFKTSDLTLAGLEDALQRLGEDVMQDEVPPRLMDAVRPPESGSDAT